MPRISIIIAHQNDQRLEETLLSVLENRPRDSEIIVAHDGSYSDPYRLQDEVLFVESSEASTRVSKLNEALYATCAPVVHILAEGLLVTEDWCEGAIHKIQRQQVAAVSPLVQTGSSRTSTVYAGLHAQMLAKRGLSSVGADVPAHCAAPALAAGFYSRRTLLSLGGLLETVDSRVADVDLALCLQKLDLVCEVDETSLVLGSESLVAPHQDARVAQDLASLLVAHQHVDSGLLSAAKGATQRLLCNLFNPSQWAPSIAWGIGLSSNRLAAQVSDRLNAWLRTQAAQSQAASANLGIFRQESSTGSSIVRKAA